MHHDPRVRQRVALALGARAEQELAHRRREPHADGGDVVGDVVHRVVDGHPRVDRAAGRVDVEEDVGLGILRRQQQQLRADRVGVLVADLGAEEHDPLAEQPAVDVVVEQAESGRAVHRGAAGNLSHVATLAVRSPGATASRALFADSGFRYALAQRSGSRPRSARRPPSARRPCAPCPARARRRARRCRRGTRARRPGSARSTALGTGRRCTTRVPPSTSSSSQIHWAPLDLVSHTSRRPGVDLGDDRPGRPDDGLAAVDPEVPLADAEPAPLQRHHLHQLRAPLGSCERSVRSSQTRSGDASRVASARSSRSAVASVTCLMVAEQPEVRRAIAAARTAPRDG